MYKYLCALILVLENTSHSNHTVLQYNCAHQYHRSDADNYNPAVDFTRLNG